MGKTILSVAQQNILDALASNQMIFNNFYLTGGTALAEFYLHHRFSEDLDFFSEQEVDPFAIQTVFKTISHKTHIKKIDFAQSFNRNLFFLHLPHEIIKTEFTYFPFPPIAQKHSKEKLTIDSLLDIAVNKIFTIYQKPRLRDFIDLYCIIQKEHWSIESLVKKAQNKFDWHVDPVQLGSQLLKVSELKDAPRMIKKVTMRTILKFFTEASRNLQGDILR
ncbi:MAG: nucleotidyl transferase AbiEii/AbiGii toxin family protein [Candidatus Magasanikbacteria bacterium]|nr:nucleotidyl transferase AbiEii/AbiGii toxin family protein [Candidatus Magasanikbacteria bacterium]